MNIQSYLTRQSKKIDAELRQFLPGEKERPTSLHRAMRYAVFSGGKRIRPILALAACEAVGGDEKKVLPTACALELIHAYSLVHDDLPCMDNDEWRRGQPTVFKKFGETTAVLAGDALLTLAFEILGCSNDKNDVISIVARAVGSKGMVGGQAVDMAFQGKQTNLPTIEYINRQKSGALIAASLRVGACLGEASQRQVKALQEVGKNLGLLFQIVDDILDKEGYAKAVGVSNATKKAKTLHKKALKALKIFGQKGAVLSQIADFVLERKS